MLRRPPAEDGLGVARGDRSCDDRVGDADRLWGPGGRGAAPRAGQAVAGAGAKSAGLYAAAMSARPTRPGCPPCPPGATHPILPGGSVAGQ